MPRAKVNNDSEFMAKLYNHIISKQKTKTNGQTGAQYKTSPSSARTYLTFLMNINGNKPFDNLDFLNDYDGIIKLINDKYQISTKKTILASIVVALSNLKELEQSENQQQKTAELLEKYKKTMFETSTKYKQERETNGKSAKQEENWLEMDQIKEIWEQLKNKVDEFRDHDQINREQYRTLLNWVVLSLYILIEPRRSLDYRQMYITSLLDTDKNINDLPKDCNYYDPIHDKFCFNIYKTAKTTGQQIIDLTKADGLLDVLNIYVKFQPALQRALKSAIHNDQRFKQVFYQSNIPFLVSTNGRHLASQSALADIFREIFPDRKMGVSLLRNIYSSDRNKDTIQSLKNQADAMGTSVEELMKTYTKFD